MTRSLRLALVAAVLAVGLVAAVPPSSTGPIVNGWIAFRADRTGNPEIFVIRPDGSQPTNLTNHPADDSAPSWSGDGTRVAFVSRRDGNDEIYVMNADGTGQTRLTNDPGFDQWPAFSPDGTKIAFRSNRDGDSEIYVMNADGTNPTNLTDDPSTDTEPAWSPDGTKIAFGSDRDGGGHVFVMNASDGSNPTNITTAIGGGGNPDWSPDGTRIVMISDLGIDDNEVVVIGTDGSSPVNLTNNEETEYDPHWSPDGTRITYECEDPVSGNLQICVMNADGSAQTTISNQDDSEPAWQPVPVPPLKVQKDRVKEGKKSKVFVELATPAVGTIPVTFKAVSGTAKRGKDFKPSTGTIVFAPGESFKVVRVKTREDAREERHKEKFFLRVAVAGVTTQGPIIILDDD